MSTVQEIEQAAMKLPRKKRAQLVERLFGSLEAKQEKEVAEVWAGEAAARSGLPHGQSEVRFTAQGFRI